MFGHFYTSMHSKMIAALAFGLRIEDCGGMISDRVHVICGGWHGLYTMVVARHSRGTTRTPMKHKEAG